MFRLQESASDPQTRRKVDADVAGDALQKRCEGKDCGGDIPPVPGDGPEACLILRFPLKDGNGESNDLTSGG